MSTADGTDVTPDGAPDGDGGTETGTGGAGAGAAPEKDRAANGAAYRCR